MIHIEQPPSNTPPELSAYLLRMFTRVNLSLKDPIVEVRPTAVLPEKVVEGRLYNFTVPIPPHIPEAGIYINLNKHWKLFAFKP